MPKRTAADMFTSPNRMINVIDPLSPSSPTNNPIGHFNNNLVDSTPSFHHYIIQTIVGPACTKCNTKIVRRDNYLFTVSRFSLVSHLKENKCFEGNLSSINLRALERSLCTSIIGLYQAMKSNPSLARNLVHHAFPNFGTSSNSPVKSSFCNRCGVFGTKFVVQRHLSSSSSKCTLADFRQEGIILSNHYSFKVPKPILSQISNATFDLPFCPSSDLPTDITYDPQTQESVSTITPPSIMSSMTPTKFLPSHEEIQLICSPDSPFDDITLIHSFAMSELLDTFGDEKQARLAMEYLTSFVHLISQASPGKLKLTLTDYARFSKSVHNHNDFNLKLLLAAGQQWIRSQSANMDVRMVPVHHRNEIYLVGRSFTDADKDLLKGCTFVWSDNIDSIISAFLSLMTFAHGSKCPLMMPYLNRVQDVYNILLDDGSTHIEPDKLEDYAATKVVNTTIISGLLTEILLEKPSLPNGPNLIYHYLASAIVKTNSTSIVSLRNANEISKKANALLRLLRHGVCSLYIRQSNVMRHKFKMDDDLQEWATTLIQDIQQSTGVGHICRTIRTAREVDRKTPHRVYKAFNESTGDLLVRDNEIAKSIWSVAIPTAMQHWDKFLFSLFPDHLSTSTLPIHWLLDLNHHIVLADDDSHIFLADSNDTSIPISEFAPSLPSYTSGNTRLVEETKKAIYECWKYNLGCHAYFSSGAARGAEIKRLPEFKDATLMWNSLCFQLRSHKNMTHGQNFNEKVQHWLPPSATRRSIICNMILFPALLQSGYHLPDDTQVNSALSEMFQETMKLNSPLDPKLNRDFIAVLTDYIAPAGLSKTSTTEQMASQFHHSRPIHDEWYSAETYRKDKDGNIIRGPLIMAQQIWRAMGECLESTNSARPTVHHTILTKSHYDYAAKRAFQNPTARVTDLQYDAIMHASCNENTKNAFVLMGCGTGKSGIYNLLLLGAYLHRLLVPKTIVISPHNSLLSQHKMQARQYLRGTNLRVSSLLPQDISAENIPSDFDLLFISIHAFNDLLSSSRHIIDGWNVKNIFIDEYHNILGELFRFTSSWQSLRVLSALNIKIMCLSATADKMLMNYLANFMCLGDYIVIGDTDKYPVPNVAINLMTSVYNDESSSLIQAVVSHCRHLVEKKRESTFKIHAITMSKDDALNLCNDLNTAGISSIWLTSELHQQQKSQLLNQWEQGSEQVLVSTFVDGIDNSNTEDVVLVGGTHSLYTLVQAIGRIRPRRQDILKSAVHIFNSSKYLKVDNRAIEDSVSRAIGANILPSQDRDAAMQYYTKMFACTGYMELTQRNRHLCIRQQLYLNFGISSSSCRYCSNCRRNNTINRSAIAANKVLSSEERNIETVLQALSIMKSRCFICKSTNCDGVSKCANKQICYACHASTVKNYHMRETCPACHPTIDTQSQSCSRCFLAISNRIIDRGTKEDHQRGGCPHRKRVKRVLLYGVEKQLDRGHSARTLLVSALSNHTHWFAVMAGNIQLINSGRKT